MKVNVSGVRSIRITTDYIKLDALLKFVSLVSTGGEAKYFIQSGEVFVGKDVCLSRGKKIRPGDVVRFGDSVILVKSNS